MDGVFGVEGVAGDDGVEHSLGAVGLRAQQPAQALRFFLAGAEGAGDLDGHGGFGQVDGEVRHLGHHQGGDFTVAESLEGCFAFLGGGFAVDKWGVDARGDLLELVDVGADDQGLLAFMFCEQLIDDPKLRLRTRRQPVAFAGFGGGVGEAFVVVKCGAHFDAFGGGDVAGHFEFFPGGVVTLGADEGEDVILAAVLAHQRGGQAEAAARLEVGGHAEHGGGQEVDFVVDDEAPVAGVEKFERAVFTLRLAGDHLVGGDGDRADLLLLPGVLADLLGRERGAAQQFVAPLAARDGVGDQDQRGGLRLRHRRRTHDGFARTARQHDDAGAALPEGLGGVLLVVAQLPTVVVERDRVRFAVDVAGEVLHRPAEFGQFLFDLAAGGGVDGDGGVVDTRCDKRDDLLGASDLGEDRRVVGLEDEPVRGVFNQFEAAVARHSFRNIHEQRLRDGEAGEPFEHVNGLLRVEAGSARVP